jgi:hypothetical protein
MAANIQEALEVSICIWLGKFFMFVCMPNLDGSIFQVGCTGFFFDEDTSATNFLIRDRRMEMLISNEPITPLISKVSYKLVLLVSLV